MSTQLLKQVVGIDVAQKKIDVSLGRMDGAGNTEVYAYHKFANNEKGFTALILWVKKYTTVATDIRFVMEATGVYHELLACFLAKNSYHVSIVLPNKMSNFFKTCEVKTITDKTMSEVIALFGLQKPLTDWAPAQKVYRDMRNLTREREQLVDQRTIAKNQKHAEDTQAYPDPQSQERIMERIKLLNKQIKQIKEEIGNIIESDERLVNAVTLITTIPGIGKLTAAIILSETDGFALIKNKRQLASYAGLDVIEKESGTSIKAKTRISKKGNRHLRKAMYMPALAAIRKEKIYTDVFTRIVSKTGIKMKGAVAVQRKLLEMVYTIFITKKAFETDYLLKRDEIKKLQEEKKRATPKELLAVQADI